MPVIKISGFLFADLILRMEMLRVIDWGNFSPGLNCLKGIPMERGFFSGGGVRFSGII